MHKTAANWFFSRQRLCLLRGTNCIFKCNSAEFSSLGRPLNKEIRFRSQVSPCDTSGGQSGTGTGFPPSTAGLPCQYNSINAQYSCTWSSYQGELVEACEPSKKRCYFAKQGVLDRKVPSLCIRLQRILLGISEHSSKCSCGSQIWSCYA
jgi:hypothetical protein